MCTDNKKMSSESRDRLIERLKADGLNNPCAIHKIAKEINVGIGELVGALRADEILDKVDRFTATLTASELQRLAESAKESK